MDRYREDVSVGERLPPLTKHPDRVQLFRFSAATWNAHRIHYDVDYARDVEGYPDVLVQSHLHGAFLLETVLRWAGPRARVLSFGWRNEKVAVPGDVLDCTAEVTAVAVDGRIDIAVEERNQDGEVCAPGSVALWLPSRDDERRGANYG